MRRSLVHPRLPAVVLVVGMLLAAALLLAVGLKMSQAEPVRGSSINSTVLADNSTVMRKPL